MKIDHAVVIGAGIAGLSAARHLRDEGVIVEVVEKEPSIGGRMSTVEFSGGVFDDGTQFFTVKDQRFGVPVDDWKARGIVKDWFHSQLIKGGANNPDGYPRYCGADGMCSIINDLADGLKIHLGTEVVGIGEEGTGYQVILKDGNFLSTDAVIIAVPALQGRSLLNNSDLYLKERDRELFERIDYSPCITVLSVLNEPSGLTEWGGLRIHGEYIDWIADNQRKGISPDATAITLQAMPQFSRDYWEQGDDAVAERLLDSAKRLLVSSPVSWRVRRWELGKPQKLHPDEWISIADHDRIMMAGDAFRGYRVEGAAVSGIEAAKQLIALRCGANGKGDT